MSVGDSRNFFHLSGNLAYECLAVIRESQGAAMPVALLALGHPQRSE